MTSADRILMFHKPKGVVVTRSDELGRRTVYDLLPDWVRTEGWQPVGRLDRDSRGLLLFVEDPLLIDKLTKPDSMAKIYDVWVRGHVNENHIEAMTVIRDSVCDVSFDSEKFASFMLLSQITGATNMMLSHQILYLVQAWECEPPWCDRKHFDPESRMLPARYYLRAGYFRRYVAGVWIFSPTGKFQTTLCAFRASVC